MTDVFISYRHDGAKTIAFLLYKDLSRDGYSVFLDHRTLGSGNFKNAIKQKINEASDVIILLSKSSFEKVFNEDDVYRFEIETSLNLGKNIIGIMLEDFDVFPDDLPESIDPIRDINCLRLYLGYYDALYEKITSENFLHRPGMSEERQNNVDIVTRIDIPKQLQPLGQLPITQKTETVHLLLQIMESFNNSERCMRYYHYFDLFDRSSNNLEVLDYQGDIPTDLVTFLSFFETLYIIVASGVIDISVIDYAYRFRFFAGCNTPLMQKSELLPLGYQYPNIISFYNMWSNYIVGIYDHTRKLDAISAEIPLYEHDLHKRYAVYLFSKNIGMPVRFRTLNRYLMQREFTIRAIGIDELSRCMAFQDEMLRDIPDNETSNFFEPLSEKEMIRAIKQNLCIGIFDDSTLVAQANYLVFPIEEENLVLDLGDMFKDKDALILDYVVVHKEVRGYGLQSMLLFMAECIARNHVKTGICAVTSPNNTHSIKNFFEAGYSLIETKKKYRSIRHYLWKGI